MQTVSSEKDDSIEEYAYQISNAALSPSGQLTRENLLNPGLQLTAFSNGERWYRLGDDVNLRKVFRDISESFQTDSEPTRLQKLLYGVWISGVHNVDETRLNLPEAARFTFKPIENSPDDFKIIWPCILFGQSERWKLVAIRLKPTNITFVYLNIFNTREFQCGELTASISGELEKFGFDINYYGPVKTKRWLGLLRHPKKGCSYIYEYTNGKSDRHVKIRQDKEGREFATINDYSDPAFISAVDSVCPID